MKRASTPNELAARDQCLHPVSQRPGTEAQAANRRFAARRVAGLVVPKRFGEEDRHRFIRFACRESVGWQGLDDSLDAALIRSL
jgi:hypothetical protein